MTITISRPSAVVSTPTRVRPSKVDPATAVPFTLDQELKPFGTWVGAPVWVPPKDSSTELAATMLRKSGWATSRQKRWASVVEEHRDSFTQVREIELAKASIRLPKGCLFVSVTEQKHFDRITDTIPACVQTRLDEFLAGPGKRCGVKVYYLKPLCLEVGNDLHFTSREEIDSAVKMIQQEVFTEYRRMYLKHHSKQAALKAMSGALAVPKSIADYVIQRRQRSIDAYEAKLEFRRRQTALDAAKTYHQHRTSGCTFDEMLSLTTPLRRDAVINQFSIDQKLSKAKRDQLLRIAAGQLPWFALSALSAGLSYMAYVSAVSVTLASPLVVCDPAFVAELPGSKGVVLNIGHFDEIGGVRHVEL